MVKTKWKLFITNTGYYCLGPSYYSSIKEIENLPFEDVLKCKYINKQGQLYVQSLTKNQEFTIFHDELNKIFIAGNIKNCYIYGKFIFCKRGNSLGIVLVEPISEDRADEIIMLNNL
jgi:hypothetical protein